MYDHYHSTFVVYHVTGKTQITKVIINNDITIYDSVI